MHLLHFGTYIELLYPYVKHGLKANTGVKNEADFTFELLGIIEKEAVYDMSASAASRYKKGRRALPEDVASSFRKDGVRDAVIHEMDSKYVPRIDQGRKRQLIKDFVNIVEQDTTIDEEFKAAMSEEAVPERLAHFLADLLIYSVGIDPTERDKEYPVEHYNLPMSNDWFTGRQKELQEISNNFADGCRMQILYGMGGMGKSQIARKYAYDHYHSYSLIHWINAHTIDSIVECYRAFLKEKQIAPIDQTKEGICQTYTKYMDSHSDWLLIYDNCDYYTDKEYADFASLCLPKNRSVGNILITSRNKRPIGKAKRMRVDSLSDVDAVSFLLQRTEAEDTAGAGQLAERLGRFPLALEIAGAYIYATPGCNFQTYMGYLEEEIKILDRMVEVMDYNNTIKDILLLTFKRIKKDHNNDRISLCVEYALHFCAYGAPCNIDLQMLAFLSLDKSDHIGIDKYNTSIVHLRALKRVCADSLKRNKLMQTLIRYGLVSEQPDGFLSIHELQQEILRNYIYQQDDWSTLVSSTLNTYASVNGLTFLQYCQHDVYLTKHLEKLAQQRAVSAPTIASIILERRGAQASLLVEQLKVRLKDNPEISVTELQDSDHSIKVAITEMAKAYAELEEKSPSIEHFLIYMVQLLNALSLYRRLCLFHGASYFILYALHALYQAFNRWGYNAVMTSPLMHDSDDYKKGSLGRLLCEIRICIPFALYLGESCDGQLAIYLGQMHNWLDAYSEIAHLDKTELIDYLKIVDAYIKDDPSALPESIIGENKEADKELTEYKND